MSEHRVKVDNGKYEFVTRDGYRLDILRHGKPWVHDIEAAKCLKTMMAELDAARVVLAAARRMVAFCERMPLDLAAALARLEGSEADGLVGIIRAIDQHHRLVDDREPPSPWTT